MKQEQVLIQDSAAFSSDLKELVSDVKESRHHCETLVEKLQVMAESNERKTDNSMQVREAQINGKIVNYIGFQHPKGLIVLPIVFALQHLSPMKSVPFVEISFVANNGVVSMLHIPLGG